MKIVKYLLPLTVLVAIGGCVSQQQAAPIANGTTSTKDHTQKKSTNKPLPAIKNRARLAMQNSRPDPVESDHGEGQDIWTLISDNLGFANDVSDRLVDRQINRYANNQAYFDRTLKRAELYLPYVLEKVLETDLPAEIALVPFIESAYNPFAYSHSGAAGLWQFIPATGDHLELERNTWYDGRRDVITSTDAAIKYLEILYEKFDGDWLLTLAAYNAGPGTIQRAIDKNELNGEPADFWSLDLHREATRYVPKLIALTKVITDPEKFGVELKPISHQSNMAVVDMDGPVNLNQAASLANVSVDKIYKLNPGYTKWVTPPEGPYHLVLPDTVSAGFKNNIAKLPDNGWQPSRTYKVVKGDTLGKVAGENNITVSELAKLNNINPAAVLQVGQLLLIPGEFEFHNASTSSILSTYQVQPGDNLWDIARDHNVSISDLLVWNDLSRRSTLQPGQTLKFYSGDDSDPDATHNYEVKSGDSLYTIAKRYKVRLKDLMGWNNLTPASLLKPGQVIKVLTF